MASNMIKKLLLPCLLLTSTFAFASPVIWIDVRSSSEYLQEHVTGAINIAHTEIAEKISSVVSKKDADLYLYCGSGRRAGIAKDTLEALGYTQVKNIGGINQALSLKNQLAH